MLYIYICIYSLLCVLKYLSGTHNGSRVDISAVNSSDIYLQDQLLCRNNNAAVLPEQSAGEQINYRKGGQSLSEIDRPI